MSKVLADWPVPRGWLVAAAAFGALCAVHGLHAATDCVGDVCRLVFVVDGLQYAVRRARAASGRGAVLQALLTVAVAAWVVRPSAAAVVASSGVYTAWLLCYLGPPDTCGSGDAIFVTPPFHAVHRTHPHHNFGHMFTLWDTLCGTARWPPITAPPYTLHPVVRRALGPLCAARIPPDKVGIHGVLYDATRLQEIHPGGRAWIALCRGTDATALYETMHIDGRKARAMLATLPSHGAYVRGECDWDFSSHRRLKRVVLERFPNRASRGPPAAAQSRFWLWVGVVLLAEGAMHLAAPMGSEGWWRACLAGGISNAVLGGYGHNYLHHLDARALALDWAGLSAKEWVLEHVASHHPYPNTQYDHDSISMLPVVHWSTPTWHNVLIYPVFAIGVVVSAVQGLVGHRFRRRIHADLPGWMALGPWLFVGRMAAVCSTRGVVEGLTTLFTSCAVASSYFAFLAHLNHAHQPAPTRDFVRHQLGSTRDLTTPTLLPELALGLDRQTMHHLLPTLDHAHLDAPLRAQLRRVSGDVRAFRQRSLGSLHASMWRRLVGTTTPARATRSPEPSTDTRDLTPRRTSRALWLKSVVWMWPSL